jgi:hypothetical protein
METFDIWLDDNQGLVAQGTDFRTGFIDNNLIKYMVLGAPGHYKTRPNIGVGIYSFINGNFATSQIERAIRIQLENDGFKQPKIDTSKFPIIYVNKTEFDASV